MEPSNLELIMRNAQILSTKSSIMKIAHGLEEMRIGYAEGVFPGLEDVISRLRDIANTATSPL